MHIIFLVIFIDLVLECALPFFFFLIRVYVPCTHRCCKYCISHILCGTRRTLGHLRKVFAQLVLFQSLLGPRHTTRIFFRFIFMPPHSVYCLEALQAHVGIFDYILYGTFGHCVLKIQILNQLLFTIFAGCFHSSFFVDKRFLFFLFSIILTIFIFFYSSLAWCSRCT